MTPVPIDTGPDDSGTEDEQEPTVKQLPELIEAVPAALGDSYLEIILSDAAVNYPIDDSLRVSVEGTYRGKKISHVSTCDTVYLHKMLRSSKIDKGIKDTIIEFIVNRLVNDSHDEEEEPHPQKTFPGSIHKELTKPIKKIPAASCTHILTSGIRKGKQCRLKASDKTGKFCHCHKRQT